MYIGGGTWGGTSDKQGCLHSWSFLWDFFYIGTKIYFGGETNITHLVSFILLKLLLLAAFILHRTVLICPTLLRYLFSNLAFIMVISCFVLDSNKKLQLFVQNFDCHVLFRKSSSCIFEKTSLQYCISGCFWQVSYLIIASQKIIVPVRRDGHLCD